jgi:hypothetical protein
MMPSGQRRMIALRIAKAASGDFMAESVEYPTILLEWQSLTAHRSSLLSRVGCLAGEERSEEVGQPHLVRRRRREVEADQALGVDDREQVVVDRRPGPAPLGFLREFAAKIPNSEHSRHTRISDAATPASASSSARNRYPSEGSPACRSRSRSIRCAPSQSRCETGDPRHL